MKKIKNLLFVLLCIAFSTTACKKEIKDAGIEEEERGDGFSLSESLLQDSLELRFMMQSNSELILSDRIIYKNSMYTLDISEQEVEELHISAELYNKHVEIIKNMSTSHINAGLKNIIYEKL